MASPGHPSIDSATHAVDAARVLRLGLACAACVAPALLDPAALERIGAHWPRAESAAPYWPGASLFEAWVWTPLVALSACSLFSAPGLALAAAFGAASGLGRWLVSALALNLVLVSSLAGLLGLVAPQVSRGASFGGAVALLALACFAFLFARVRGGARLPWPARFAESLAPTIAVPWLLLAALGPKLHWESFNGDGVHAFESIRLLLVQPTPFWPADAGAIRGFPGLTSMLFAFPGAWFLRLFGENEGAARVSVALYLAGVFGGVAAFVEHARGALRAVEAWLVWAALAVYTLAMAFSASYDPYSADIALPATQDTLTVACVLGAVAASLRGERAWTALFTALSYASLPSGLMLLGLWSLAAALFVRPRPLRGVATILVTLAACGVLARLAPTLLEWLGQPRPGDEYESLLTRFSYLQVTDARRVLFALAPCGIVPGLALLAWRRFDAPSHALALVALGYFAFFYVQAYVSLHHFVPAMLLPLASFWRSGPAAAESSRKALLAATAAGLALATWWSWPASAAPVVHARRVGASLFARVEGYERSAPESLAAASALRHLFPSGLSRDVPDASYGGSPYIWNRYAARNEPTGAINYVLQREGEPAPVDAEKVGVENGFALYVRDRELWRAHAAAALPHPPGAALYEIDRGRLFLGAQPRRAGPAILDLRDVRKLWTR
jgi:hypothetical protein